MSTKPTIPTEDDLADYAEDYLVKSLEQARAATHAASAPKPKKRKLNAQHRARINLIHEKGLVPNESYEVMEDIRKRSVQFVNSIETIFEETREGFQFDEERLTDALDLIQQVKNILYDSIVLPHRVDNK